MPMRNCDRRARAAACALALLPCARADGRRRARAPAHSSALPGGEGAAGRMRDEIGVRLLHRVEAALDLAHVVHVLDGALLAGGDDDALRLRRLLFGCADARGVRLLGALLVDEGLGAFARGAGRRHVDERAQALVLAEVAARALVAAWCGTAMRCDGVQADERASRGPRSVAAAPPRARRRWRPTRRVLVHEDVGVLVLAGEAALDEVHLRLHRGQVVLRAALQHEAPAELGQVRDLRDVEPDVLGQHGGQARP